MRRGARGAADGNTTAFCFLCFAKTYALSPDGRSKSFDATADGIGLGEGVGAIVLKRLSDAQRDGDFIYAVLKGIGSSSDGRNGSLTAPVPAGQLSALERAYADAAVSPGSVSFVEAHSTGTSVGDRVECEALNHLLRESGSKPQSCALGSVKSMIGHTKTAAGLAGLIKSSLALKHHVLPPTIGVNQPNKVLCDPASALYVNTENRPWLVSNGHAPRRAGVSSFGFGGTNFHAVLEEYTGEFHDSDRIDLNPRPCEIFTWRRASRGEIGEALRQFLSEVSELASCELAELAAALLHDEMQRGRAPTEPANCRLAIVAQSFADLKQKLDIAARQISTSEQRNQTAGIYYSEAEPIGTEAICFLFPGQGSQSPNMLRELVLAHPELHSLFESADVQVQGILPEPLSSYIYPPPTFDNPAPKSAIHETFVAQPAMAVADLFCSQLLSLYGIEAAMVAGHSFGEYAALAAAEAISPHDLFRLSALRGQAAHRSGLEGSGAMAAIGAGVDETMKALQEFGIEAFPANINAPHQTVIAGGVQSILEAVTKLPRKRISARRLAVSAAFHTPLLAEGAKELAQHLAATPFSLPKRTVFSNTTADVYPTNVDEMRQLLTRHLIEPVRFHQQILRIYEHGARVFIEAGPGSVLTNLTTRILEGKPFTAIAMVPNGQNDLQSFGILLARSWVLGLPVRLERWFQYRRLPTYGLQEFFSREKTKHTRQATDWVVNSSRAIPVSAIEQRRPPRTVNTMEKASAAKVASAAKSGEFHRSNGASPVRQLGAPNPVVPSAPVAVLTVASNTISPHPRVVNPIAVNSQPVAPKKRIFPSRNGPTVMPTSTKTNSDQEFSGSANPTPTSFLSEHNQVMSKWLELQIRQVQANERFLEAHERVISNCLTNSINPLAVGVTENVVQARLSASDNVHPAEAEVAFGDRRRLSLPTSSPRLQLPVPKKLTPARRCASG